MSLPTIYSAKRIFTGETWLDDHAIVVSEGFIEQILPVSEIRGNQNHQDFGDAIISPAFMDLQIYGALGKLFAVYQDTDSLTKLNDYCRSGGAAWCMPTVATNPIETFYHCIDAINAYWNEGGQGVLGLHIEGPWINPIKRGAHIAELIHKPQVDEVRKLLDYGRGVIRMITVAPEVCSKDVIDLILSHGIIISAGHSNATYDEARNAFGNGIKTATHLFNAMRPLQHRAPGLAGAILDDDRVMASIIPDGHHVDFAAVRIAKKAMGERLFVITDAVTETTEGYYPHKFADDKYESGGILSGSALNMSESVRRLIKHCGIEPGEAIRMCSLYPARVIGMEQRAGRIEKGYFAKMAVLDKEFKAISTIG